MSSSPQVTLQQPFICWHNGKLVPSDMATVSVFDHGMLYGDGAFEGLRFYNGRPFKLDKHLKRLRRSLQALSIKISFSDIELCEGIQQSIDASPDLNGYIRVIVTRGVGTLGLNPKNCTQANVYILCARLELVDEQTRNAGVKLITSSIVRATGTGLDARIKSLNYLHSILAKIEANDAAADDALLLNQFGKVAECSAANIFIVKDRQLLTPPCTDGALEGITRGSIIEIAASLSIPVAEKSLATYDIYNADECFLTGSGARLIPVREVDSRKIRSCPGQIYEKLYIGFKQLIEDECPI